MSKSLFFQLGAVFAGLVLLSIIALEGRNLGAAVGLVENREEPVLVFAIPNAESLARVRSVISEGHVLVEGESGFSAANGRVYVQRVEDAGDLIARGGWVDRPVQIVSLGMDSGAETEADSSVDGGTPRMTREERMLRLRQLVHKPTLTRGEQVFVLQAMNDGLEI